MFSRELWSWHRVKPEAGLATWVILNGVDIAISHLAISRGAMEVGLLYQLTGSFSLTVLLKMALALLVGVLLLNFGQLRLLRVLSLAMLAICLYGALVLFWQLSC